MDRSLGSLLRAWLVAGGIVLGVGAAAPGAAAPPDRPDVVPASSAGLIWEALDRGELSEPEAARLFLRALYRPARLPARFRGSPEAELLCATPQWELIDRHWPTLDEESRRLVPFVSDFDPGVLGRDDDYDGDWADSLATDHFLILHTLDASDPMHTTIEYRDLLAEYLEKAFLFYRDHPDFRMPEARGTGPPGPDGFPLIRVRVLPLSDALGYARVESPISAACPWASSGSLRIRPNLQPGTLQRTTAHEVWHLFEYAIHPFQGSWLNESTARWAEGEVWPGTFRDGASTVAFMRKPYSTLWSTSPYQRTYGGSVFWGFLEEFLGEGATVQVWKESCGPLWVDALDGMLAEGWGLDFDEVLAEFWRWNYRAGYRDDGQHYPDGERLPFPPAQLRTEVPESGELVVPSHLLASPAGTNFVEILGAARRENLRVVLDGDPATHGHRVASVVATTAPNTHTEDQIRLPNADGDCEFVVAGWHLYDTVSLILTNFRSASEVAGALEYRILVEEVGDPVFDLKWAVSPLDFREVTLTSAPNPFGANTQIRYRAAGRTSVTVHDAQGRLVRSLATRSADEAGDYYVTWDARDNRGRPVAAGMYFLNLDSADGARTRKVSVLR